MGVLLSSVNSLMINKIWKSTEGFATLITWIGFLSSVNSLMQNKLIELWLKAFPHSLHL